MSDKYYLIDEYEVEIKKDIVSTNIKIEYEVPVLKTRECIIKFSNEKERDNFYENIDTKFVKRFYHMMGYGKI